MRKLPRVPDRHPVVLVPVEVVSVYPASDRRYAQIVARARVIARALVADRAHRYGLTRSPMLDELAESVAVAVAGELWYVTRDTTDVRTSAIREAVEFLRSLAPADSALTRARGAELIEQRFLRGESS